MNIMAEEAQASSSFCAVALHIPTSSIQFGPDIVVGEIPPAFYSLSQPRRPHPGGLDTLPEASHVNALAHATGPSPPSLQATIADTSLSNKTPNDANDKVNPLLSPAISTLHAPSRSRAIAHAKGYSGIVVSLANERWRERWSRLCLAFAESSTSEHTVEGNSLDTNETQSFHASGVPDRTGGSWKSLAQASGAAGLDLPMEGDGEQKMGKNKMTRSSSRKQVNDTRVEGRLKPLNIANSANESVRATSDNQQEAEMWRQRPSFHPGEVNLLRYEDGEGVTAVISPWIELDSIDEGIRLDSELALRQELSYAAHLGVTQIILPPPSSDPACRPFLLDYARALAGCLVSRGSEAPAAGHFAQLTVRMPIASPYLTAQTFLRSNGARPSSISSNGSNGTVISRGDDDWTWQTWNVLRNVCGNTTRLSVALDLSAPLPSSKLLERWHAEPVTHVWLPARAFLSNAKGFPVLSKAVQSFLRSLISLKAPNLCFVLIGTQTPPEHHTRGGQAAYEQYVRHLEKAVALSKTEAERQANTYADYLQAPLQPLFDNLEGQTYATFEADTIKYEKYEEAIAQALRSLSGTHSIEIWVCGAGRGPLVACCIGAAQRVGRRVHIVALEKNPNAIVGLRERVVHEWGQDVVQVELGDMRTFAVPKDKADIIVSELLGSFGDNELSPECLDGAMRILKPNGVCIPRAYSSYITPISAPRLHSEIARGVPVSGAGSAGWGVHGLEQARDKSLRAAETPYVVLLRAVTHIAAQGGRENWPEVQHCWTFDHSTAAAVPKSHSGLPITNGHNVRLSSHTFYIPHQCVCHGIAGSFEAHLWGTVALSIHPDAARATKGMMSWFPIFFPFKEPLILPAESELDISIWRMSSSDRVWYEWMAQSYVVATQPMRALSSLGLEADGSAQTRLGASGGQTHHDGQLRSENKKYEASPTPNVDAFQNAPNTPWISDAHVRAGEGESAARERVLVGMTCLMNPGGRSSSVLM